MFPTLSKDLAKTLQKELRTDIAKVNPKLWPVVARFFLAKSARQFPYHNNVHTALFMRAVVLSFSHYKLSKKDKHNLITAALFHDYNYQSAMGDDIENIKKARMAWAESSYEFMETKKFPVDPRVVSSLIYATYLGDNRELDKNSELYVLETIMRDSGFLCWIYEPYQEAQRIGLEAEKGIPISVGGFVNRFSIYNNYAINAFKECGLD